MPDFATLTLLSEEAKEYSDSTPLLSVRVSADYADKAEFVKVDVDEAPALSAKYGIMSIPFVAVFKDGDMAAKSVGFMPEGEVRQFLDENL